MPERAMATKCRALQPWSSDGVDEGVAHVVMTHPR
jgi:hypothetical protein